MNLPKGLSELSWEHLDFLGWRDPGAPDRGYLVVEPIGADDATGPIGISLRAASAPKGALAKPGLCSVCLTQHSGTGVDLMTAPRAGAAGRQGNSVGTYMCADMACSLYIRGRRKTEAFRWAEETLTLDQRIARIQENLAGFVSRVLQEPVAPA